MPFDTIIKLLQLGVSGFAVVCLYLGFILIKDLSKQMNQGEIKAEQIEIYKMKIRNNQFFLVIALLFFLGGVAYQLATRQGEVPIHIYMNPERMPADISAPSLRINGMKCELKNPFRVTYKDSLQFDFTGLTEKIRDLLVDSQLSRSLANDKAETSNEGGI